MDSITTSHHESGMNPPAGGWSSLIGIVTAIVGNVLISFALNTQRYAHLRLGRQREEEAEKKKRRRRSKSRGYGTTETRIQEDVAEERRRANVKGAVAGGHGTGEESPLIPKVTGKVRDGDDEEEDWEDQEDGEDETEQKSYLKSPIWWLGIAMMTVGEAGNFLAYGFAPASIVSPMGVVALVSNCLIAPLLLGERFRWRDGVGVIIAIAGCVTVVLSASSSNPRLTPESIWTLITQWEFETYLGITVFLILALTWASNKFGDRSILIDLGLVGLFGGYTALSTKGIASLLSNKVWRVITFPITYLLVAVLVFTAVMQIKYVNRALQRFNATMVIPTQFVMFTLSVIIGSAVLYRDFERESTENAIKFVAGCALTFLGVWCITSGRNDDEDDDEEYGNENGDISMIDEEAVERDIEGNLAARRRFFKAQAHMKHIPRTDARPPKVLITPGLDEAQGGTSPPLDLDQPLMKAAIHSDAAKLPPPQRPAVHATTSDPTIALSSPSTARPKTPLGRSTTYQTSSPTSQHRLQTPRNNSTPQLPEPSSTTRNRLLPRTSLFPGPLTSPLSASLTAVVADSLRRGVDTSSNPSLRRRPSAIHRRPQSRPQSTSVVPSFPQTPPSSRIQGHAPPRTRHSIASGEMDVDENEMIASLRARAAAGTGTGTRTGTGESPRTRSLSTTLSDVFGPVLKRKGTGSSSHRNNNDS